VTLMEFTMIPLDKGPSLSQFVADVLDIVDTSGLAYQLTPMGTIVEGKWDDLLSLLDRCFKATASNSERISLSVKFDHRTGDESRLVKKIESVESKLGRKLRTQ
jgi:uncharacterized protein (TIGR00106 family)